MPGRVLIAYGTKRGATREVADAVGEELETLGFEVEIAPAAEVEELTGFEAVVVGGSLYMGRWHPDAVGFLARHRESLGGNPLALFGIGPRTTDPSDVADARRQLAHSLAKARVVPPADIAIFGGVIDPAKLRFPLNRLPASDARDWDAIRTWAKTLARHFGKAAVDARDPRKQLQQTPR